MSLNCIVINRYYTLFGHIWYKLPNMIDMNEHNTWFNSDLEDAFFNHQRVQKFAKVIAEIQNED